MSAKGIANPISLVGIAAAVVWCYVIMTFSRQGAIHKQRGQKEGEGCFMYCQSYKFLYSYIDPQWSATGVDQP